MFKKTLISSLAVAMTLSAAGASMAQPRGDDHGPGRGEESRGQRPEGPRRDEGPRPQGRDDRHAEASFHGDRGAGPNHDFRRGGRLPSQYRNRQYVVNDWRGHHLSAPPRGYQWVQTGADYVLIAAATGLIAQIILSQ